MCDLVRMLMAFLGALAAAIPGLLELLEGILGVIHPG